MTSLSKVTVEPMIQLAGGPAAGRTFLPGTVTGRELRVPIPQPLTLAEDSGGCRIARYVRWDVRHRPDLYLFDGYEDNLEQEQAKQARIAELERELAALRGR